MCQKKSTGTNESDMNLCYRVLSVILVIYIHFNLFIPFISVLSLHHSLYLHLFLMAGNLSKKSRKTNANTI